MIEKKKGKQFSIVLKALILFFQIVLYIPLQLVFIPFAIIGIIDAVYKEMVKSKKLGVSFTAVQALQYRWIMHYFNTREDSLSIRFIKKFPCESHFGLCSTFGALVISQRLFGFTTKFGKLDEIGEETIISTPGRRLIIFDEIIKKYVDEVEQIVMPGAGYDLLAIQYTKDKNVKVFEIDQVQTQKIKIETLIKAKIKHDWISFVPVDYNLESWSDKLVDAGFDKTKKTLFIWQSVSLYLEEDTVKDTLKRMADLCVEGSIVAQDFYSEKFMLGETSKTVKKSSNLMGKMGEIWKFGIDMSNKPNASVESFLAECGLKMTKINQFGEKLNVEPFYCIVEAEKI
jgi:methyltransferase (TIGR00027 family)